MSKTFLKFVFYFNKSGNNKEEMPLSEVFSLGFGLSVIISYL